jgi:hypothetical protein
MNASTLLDERFTALRSRLLDAGQATGEQVLQPEIHVSAGHGPGQQSTSLTRRQENGERRARELGLRERLASRAGIGSAPADGSPAAVQAPPLRNVEELAAAIVERRLTGDGRLRSLARYARAIESVHHPELREILAPRENAARQAVCDFLAAQGA